MIKALLHATILLAASWSASAATPKPICKVNGVPVYGEGAYFLLMELKREGLPVSVSALGSDVVDTEVLRQEAVRKGVDKASEAKKAMAERTEAALAAVCRGELKERTPAATREEVDAAWNWAKAKALTEYKLYRAAADTAEEAGRKRKEWQAGLASSGFFLRLEQPFWAILDDEDLDPGERAILRQFGGLKQSALSEPYPWGDRYAFLQFTGDTRKVDPLLRHPLNDYAFGEAGGEDAISFQKEFMPALHERKVLERLRAAAQQSSYPASGGPWPVAMREAQAAVDQRLLAEEARRMGLEKEDWVVSGLAIVRARALARTYFEQHLARQPVTEAALRKAFEREDGAPVQYQLRSYQFPTEAEARAALVRLKTGASLPAKETAGWGDSKDLLPEVASALRKLARGAWSDQPIAVPDLKAHFLICWTDLRHSEGFDEALERRRNSLLRELKQQRYYDLVSAARKAAKIETVK